METGSLTAALQTSHPYIPDESYVCASLVTEHGRAPAYNFVPVVTGGPSYSSVCQQCQFLTQEARAAVCAVGHLRNILSSLYPYLLHSPLRPNISPGWASEASTVHTQPRHRSQRPTKTVVQVANLEQGFLNLKMYKRLLTFLSECRF
jgi:hypothetical protein